MIQRQRVGTKTKVCSCCRTEHELAGECGEEQADVPDDGLSGIQKGELQHEQRLRDRDAYQATFLL